MFFVAAYRQVYMAQLSLLPEPMRSAALFWSAAMGITLTAPRSRPALTLVSSNPALVRSERRASLAVVR